MKIVSNITRKEAGECISRQCVLDKIQRLIDAERNNIDENGDYMNYARERVNAYEAIQFFVENDCLCPSVTPQEPRKGHWIEHEWEEMREKGYYRCSVCNHGYQRYTKGIRKSDVPYIDGQEYKLWNCDNYCPNCGADMREVVKE